MHLGKHDLNQNETEWFENFAKDTGNLVTKQVISALNKKVDSADVIKLLSYLWARSSKPEVDIFEVTETESEDE